MFLSNQSVGSGDLRNQLDQMVSERLINLYNILQKGHAAEQNPMTLFLETSWNFRQKLADVFRHSLDNLDRCQNGFLSYIGRAVADTLP